MSLYETIISLIWPERCPYCNCVVSKEEIACEKCIKKFPDYTFKRFAKGGYRCFSPFAYSEGYKKAVNRFKFRNYRQFSRQLVYPMTDALKKNIPDVDFDYITYVPMHKKKINKRGYNQAQLLAKDLGNNLNLPCKDVLTKIVNNKEQHKCHKKDRSKNVKGVYKSINKENIKDKTILLVDDIITTGSTLGECCKTLSKSGAKDIYCVTVCATNSGNVLKKVAQ